MSVMARPLSDDEYERLWWFSIAVVMVLEVLLIVGLVSASVPQVVIGGVLLGALVLTGKRASRL